MALALKQLSESIFTEQMLTKWATVLKFMFATEMSSDTLFAGKICVRVDNATSLKSCLVTGVLIVKCHISTHDVAFHSSLACVASISSEQKAKSSFLVT